jgi:hypothetical protein
MNAKKRERERKASRDALDHWQESHERDEHNLITIDRP